MRCFDLVHSFRRSAQDYERLYMMLRGFHVARVVLMLFEVALKPRSRVERSDRAPD